MTHDLNDQDDPQVKSLLEQLRAFRATGKGVEDCISTVRSQLQAFGVHASTFDSLDRASEILKHEFSAHEILHEHTCVDRHEPWYYGVADDARHWPALKTYLREIGRDDETIGSIDLSSDEIVSMLGNPAGQTPFQRRGLVVGYVQSGKTASMTAVIAKAVDAGYNMVIVLAGLTDKLRQQTQGRLEKDLFGDRPGDWRTHTSDQPGDDFEQPRGAGGMFVAHPGVTHLLVLKKTTLRSRRVANEFAGPLGKLEATLRCTHQSELRKLRVLVLDDECDQATVNSANGDMDVSVINDCVRRVLSHMPYVSYVGYTATPFANVLINPYPNDRARNEAGQLDDLYPKSFITVLPKPDAYFGSERLFGRLSQSADNTLDDDGLPYLKDIPTDDETQLQPASRSERETFEPAMPLSLENAILYFLACCAARVARGDAEEHMTMLLHTSVYKDMHKRTATLVEDWTGQQRPLLADRTSTASQRLIKLFREEQQQFSGAFPNLKPVAPEVLHDHLPDVLRDLTFPIENGSSDDRVNYSGSPKRYIVTGGSILARGLTLDGLMVSYFLRSTTQFDTLLQMGRWFGYRSNHQDLPRIWTTVDLQERFAQLADVEAHIREDIGRYREQNMTPMELAVRIPLIPGMAITGAAKMRHAQPARVSYHGQREQTTRFYHRDADIVAGNWHSGVSLLERAEQLNCRDTNDEKFIWRRVPLAPIRRFLRDYYPHEIQKSLNPAMLEAFLDRCERRDTLLSWNVAIVSTRNPSDATTASLGPITVNLSQRSKMASTDANAAWLKALLSVRDCLLDVSANELPSPLPTSWDAVRELRQQMLPGTPLLLLFPIDANSQAAPRRDGQPNIRRQPLDAIDHLLGYAIVFPESGQPERDLVEVDLQPPHEEETGEIEQEEAAMAESAGEPLSDD